MENLTAYNVILRCPDIHNQVDMCSWQFVTKTIILSMVTLTILIGNSLVIIAVTLSRKLRKSVSNSFIASLAVADLLLAILVLPLSVAKEIFGYWMFGTILCQMWLMTDISVCTASILHLCAISLDRYIAIAHPLRYPNLMTQKRSRIICLSMWLLSLVICFPALIKWDEAGVPPTLDYLNETMINQRSTGPAEPDQCNVTSANSAGYTIYSALGSFFIPSIVMTGFYIKIFLLARKFMMQAHRGTIGGRSNGIEMRIHRGPSTTRVSLYKTARSLYEMSGLLATSDTNNATAEDNHSDDTSYRQELSVDDSRDINQNACDNASLSSEHPMFSRKSSTKSDYKIFNSLKKTRHTISNAMSRETKAAKTVAIIIGAFILCWCPFFICYLIEGVSNYEINKIVFSTFFWIGYLNSLLNPCIYACFSNDFRNAFKKILKCEFRRDMNRKRGMFKYISSFYISSSSGRTNSIAMSISRPNTLGQSLAYD